MPAATESVNATLQETTGRRYLGLPTGSLVRLEEPLVCPSVSLPHLSVSVSHLSARPFVLSHPSVPATPDDDLWAVTPPGGLSRRLTKLLPQTQPSSAPSGPSHTGDDVDDEWELI